MRLQDGRLCTFPVAGSRPRGATVQEDLALEKDLLSDEKELSEHNMLVDLGRNDLGKISNFSSVEVTEYMMIHRYSRSCISRPVSKVIFEMTMTRAMRWRRCFLREPYRAHRRYAHVRSSKNWKKSPEVFTAVRSVILILRETLILVSQYVWQSKKTTKYMCKQAEGSSRTVFRDRI